MGKLYNTISFAPGLQSLKGFNYLHSSSITTPGVEGYNVFNEFKKDNIYNPMQGAFLTQLKLQDLLGQGSDIADTSEQFAFYGGEIFSFDLGEFYTPGTVNSAFLNSSGGGGNNFYATALPVTCKVQGVVYDNTIFANNLAQNRFASQFQLTQSAPQGGTITNAIPVSNQLENFLEPGTDSRLVFNSTGLGVFGGIPDVNTFVAPAGTYDFEAEDTVEFRKLSVLSIFPPSFWPQINPPVGFRMQVESFDSQNRILTLKPHSGGPDIQGSFGGFTSPFRITNASSQDNVNSTLEELLHFEFIHSLYPCNSAVSGGDNPTPFIASGNQIQGIGGQDNNITFESQLTYRKFYNQQFGALTGDEINDYSNTFQVNESINSPYNNNKAFTLYFDPVSLKWLVQGAFKRVGNIIVRGHYEIF